MSKEPQPLNYGTVVTCRDFNAEMTKGWGFIRPDDGTDDIWFGTRSARWIKPMVRLGDRVSYSTRLDNRKSGKFAAGNMWRVPQAETDCEKEKAEKNR